VRRIVLLLVASIVLATAASVQAHPRWKHEEPLAAPLVHDIRWFRAEANDLRVAMAQRPWPTRRYEVRFPEMRPWLVELWRGRWKGALTEWRRYYGSWEAQERNWHLALSRAAARFGVSYGWLHSCNHSEGGHGFVWNNQGSGAFGPMQFMEGTFYGFVGRAQDAAGFPDDYARWDSYVGQAYTAAYMFASGGSSHWTGSGC
jgi:hypothetical protein